MPLMEIPASQTGRWLLVIQSSKPNQTVTLRWRSSRQLASKAILVDPITRRSVNLSGAGELSVVTDEQGKKQMVLNLGIPTDVPLRIVDLKVTRTRGKGYIISGRLTAPATVQAEIRTLTGRLVRVLVDSSEPKTQIQLLWDGRSIDGQILPSTPLLLRLSARDNLGRETQRVVVLR
jgi:hypothetical protein